jgi:hypothetical protein
MPPFSATKKSILVIAAQPTANQIFAWLTSFGLPAPQVDIFTDPQTGVDALRSASYKMIIVSHALAGAKGYAWYRALRTLAPQTHVVMFGGEVQIPTLSAAAQKDKFFVYLPTGITKADLGEYASAWLPAVEPSHTSMMDGDPYQRCETLLKALREAVNAHAIYLVNTEGRVLASVGDAKAESIGQVGALLGGSFAALFEVGRLLGYDDSSMNLIFRQGIDEELYGMGVNANLSIVVLIVRGAYAAKIGTVWYYTQNTSQAVNEILAAPDSPTVKLVSRMLDESVVIEADNAGVPDWLEKLEKLEELDNATRNLPMNIEDAIKSGVLPKDFIERNPNLYSAAQTGTLGDLLG